MKNRVALIIFSVATLSGCNSEIKDAVASKLKDPSSARFDRVLVAGTRACAVFDAKNGLGNYAGPSTAQLINLGAEGGQTNWYVENIDQSECSKYELERKLAIDSEDKASDKEIIAAVTTAKLIPTDVKDITDIEVGDDKCSKFASDVIGNAHLAHAATDPTKKSKLQKSYEEGLAQIKGGQCRYIDGSWTVKSEKSKIDDSQNVYLSLLADDSAHSSFGTVTPSLQLRCAQGTISAYINWDLFLGSDETSVLTRLDSMPAKTQEWPLSTDNKATFVPGDENLFLENLFGHKKLVAQVTPYDESPVMASFSLEGLEHAAIPLQKACRK